MIYRIILENDDTTGYADADKGENLSSEISNAMQKNPMADKIKVDNQSISSGNQSKPEITVSAKDGQEAKTKIDDMLHKNPQVNNLVQNNQADIVVQRESKENRLQKLEEATRLTLTKESFRKYALWK